MAKGSGYERNICKKLSLWWSNEKKDDIFWRTSQSGGRATQRMKSGCTTENSSGDACYLDAVGKPLVDLVCIEMKKGYTSKGRLTADKKKKIKTILKVFSHNPKQRLEQASKSITKIFSSTKKAAGIDILDIIDGKRTKNQSTIIGFWDKCEKDRIKSGRYFSWIIFHRDQKKDTILFNDKFFRDATGYCGPFEDDSILISTQGRDNLFVLEFEKFLKWVDSGSIKLILEEKQKWRQKRIEEAAEIINEKISKRKIRRRR